MNAAWKLFLSAPLTAKIGILIILANIFTGVFAPVILGIVIETPSAAKAPSRAIDTDSRA